MFVYLFVCMLLTGPPSQFPPRDTIAIQAGMEITESLLISDLNAKISRRSDPDTSCMLIQSVNNTSDYNQMITPADMCRTGRGWAETGGHVSHSPDRDVQLDVQEGKGTALSVLTPCHYKSNCTEHQPPTVNVKGRGKVRGMSLYSVKEAICHCSASHYRGSNL